MSHRHRTIRTPPPSRDAETSAAVPWRRSTPWLPGGALLGILAVKLVVLGQLASHPLLQPRGVLDDAVYLKLAQRVASGDLALGPDVYYLSPFYMYFLGAILAAGGSVFAARAVQVVLGSVAVLLVGLTARRWFGARAAVAASVAAALTGLFTFNEVLLLQSSVDPFLSALALWALACALGGGRPSVFLGAGGALGLLAVNRPNVLAAVVLIAAAWAMLRPSRAALVQIAALALGVSLVVAPVALRNRVVAGEWALVTSHGGLNFYIGNHEGARGTWSQVPGIAPSIEGQSRDATRVASAALGRPATSLEASDYFYRLGWQWMRDHPAAATGLWLRKLALTFNATDLALNYSFTYFARDERTLLGALAVGPWLLVPLGLLGLGLGLRRPGGASYASWAAFVPGYAASLVIFFVSSRYRLPLLVALCIGTGHAIDWAWSRVAARAWRPLALAGAVVAALGAIAWLPLEADVGRMYERTEQIVLAITAGRDDEARMLLADTEARHPERALLLYRAGRAWQDRGENASAVPLFERALAANPGQADIRFSLGEALLALGRAADAVPHLDAARQAGVEPTSANLDLARAYAALGRKADVSLALRRVTLPDGADESSVMALGAEALGAGDAALAEQVARRSLSKRPTSGPLQELLGMALMLQDRRADGEAALRESIRLDPSSATAHYHLALAEAQGGRFAEAVRLLDETLRLKPDYPEARLLLERLRTR